MSRREILLKAIEVIEERGWGQNPDMFDDGGPVCIQSAVCVAGGQELLDGLGFSRGIYCYAPSVLGIAFDPEDHGQAWRWNDARGRTKEEVVEALRFLADTDMSWDDAMDLWKANESLSAFPVETRQLVAVAA